MLINNGITTDPYSSPLGLIILLIGSLGPPIAAIALQEKVTLKSIAGFVFNGNYRASSYLLLFCLLLTAAFWLPARTLQPDISLSLLPVYLLLMTTLGGGLEELGWRGTMQPTLEKIIPFPLAVLLTSVTWSVWHVPLWFVHGSNQQAIPFIAFITFELALSFALAVIYRKTKSVFYCCLYHGFSNTLGVYFVIGINWILAAGGVVIIIVSLLIWYYDGEKN